MIKQPRILILEDIPFDAELAIRELRRAQLIFEAKRVDNKDAFLHALKEFAPDIILSDYNLPQFSAIDALRLLKEIKNNTPLILYTGSLTEEVAVECMKEGAADYILKSSLTRLPSAIVNVLEKQETQNAKERAIAALQESEERLRTILDGSRDGIVIEDGEKIVYTNNSFTQTLGYDSPKDLIGRNIAYILPPNEAERLEHLGRQRLEGKDLPSTYEFTGKCRSGSLVDLEATVSISVIGGQKYVMTAVRDITERKQSERELYKLAAIVESSQDAIISKNLDSIIISWNKGAERVFGYQADDVVGRHISILFPPDRFNEETEIIEKIRAGQTLEQFETIRVKKDGSPIHVSITISPIKDGTGKIIGISKVAHDITKRKQSSLALRESEYKMRTLLANMNEGLVQVNNEEIIEFVNDRFCLMTGYQREELVGKITLDILFDEEGCKFVEEANRQRTNGVSSQYELSLKKKSGETVNVIVGGAPIISPEGIVTGSMGVFTDITERKRAEKQLHHDAFHDGLTGLANRSLFMNHLQLTIERNKRKLDATFAVLFLDFDRFKVINDSLGHSEGDRLLKQIAARLEFSLRPGDLVARLGGDEFTILLTEVDDESDVLRIAERIQESLKLPFELYEREIFTSASIGITLSTTGYERAEDMLRDADIAMYRAKANGKAQYQVFDQAMHAHALQQLQLETEMRYALERGEFSLNYQPIIKLETNDLIGFEALVRWNHPQRGLISPLDFIPIAEETGLILPLGKWIMQEACRQLRKWQNHNSLASSISISVNLSCKQFLQFDLAEQVAVILKETELSPSCLKLEITESYILENTETAVATMNRLRDLGIELSLDDFGTGYSSLSYLHSLPIDYLKIDRSFVNRMTESREHEEIIYTIIKLAQNLKMKVIAEGVETIEQLTRLKQLKCEYGQGYFFSKPLKASAVALVNSARMEVTI